MSALLRRGGRLALLAAIASPTVSPAQASVEVGPLVGYYAPVGSFGTGTSSSTAMPNNPIDLAGLARGADLRVWFNRRFGLEIEGEVATSRFGGGLFTPGDFVTTPKEAQVVTTSVQALVRPAPGVPLSCSVGVGVVHRGGTAYQGFAGQGYLGLTSVGGTLGLGYDVRFGRFFKATAGLDALLYPLDVHDSLDQRYETGFQTDLLATLSISVLLVRHQ